ncbi:MAG: hypothetical protein ACRDK3_13840 [Actinomycetota bacterium]
MSNSDKLEKELEDMFNETPEPRDRRDRAMFVAGVAARRPPPVWRRALVPATAIFLILFALSIGSLRAAPGQALYPVRKALSALRIAQPPVELVERQLRAADADIERADDVLDAEDFNGADDLIASALRRLGRAQGLLGELRGEQREDFADEIVDLGENAQKLQQEVFEERLDAQEERAKEAEDAAEESRESREEEREDEGD